MFGIEKKVIRLRDALVELLHQKAMDLAGKGQTVRAATLMDVSDILIAVKLDEKGDGE
jgi:hypothetical protein